MGRAPCCDKANVKRGPWSPEEDSTLKNYVEKYGTGGNWIALPQKAGLKRCGKSCRLRWLNYLRPNIKHGGFTEEEDNIICSLYTNIGSRWSVIASRLPGRTDNDVKNYWNTKLKKKLMTGQTSPSTANISITPGNRIRHSTTTSPSPSPPFSVNPTVKTESYGCGNFSMPTDGSCTVPSNSGFDQFTPDSFPVSSLMDHPSDFGGSTANGYVVSPPQTISAASSSLTTENNSNSYVSWPGNGGGGGGGGGGGEDPFFMDFGFGAMNFLGGGGGYGVQDKIGELVPGYYYAPNPTGLVNLWANAETKPQGLHQSVMHS